MREFALKLTDLILGSHHKDKKMWGEKKGKFFLAKRIEIT